MPHRQRHQPTNGEFQDPLENYDPIQFRDAFEKVLCRSSIAEVQSTPVAKLDAASPVKEALRTLSELDVACLLIVQDDQLVGIFTERDVLNKIAPDYEGTKDKTIAEVMTPNPAVVYETDRAIDALSAVAVSGHRHVPVLDVNDHIVGVVSPQRINAFLRNHFEEIGKSA